jgi:hypothetical protein
VRRAFRLRVTSPEGLQTISVEEQKAIAEAIITRFKNRTGDDAVTVAIVKRAVRQEIARRLELIEVGRALAPDLLSRRQWDKLSALMSRILR